jgi:hypothetical protein
MEKFGVTAWRTEMTLPNLQDEIRRHEIMQPGQSDRHFHTDVVVIVDPDHRVIVGSSFDIKLLKAHFALCGAAERRIPSPNESVIRCR